MRTIRVCLNEAGRNVIVEAKVDEVMISTPHQLNAAIKRAVTAWVDGTDEGKEAWTRDKSINIIHLDEDAKNQYIMFLKFLLEREGIHMIDVEEKNLITINWWQPDDDLYEPETPARVQSNKAVQAP